MRICDLPVCAKGLPLSFTDRFTGLCLFMAAPSVFGPGAFIPGLKFRKGQNTVEFLLMLAVVASIALMIGILFHKKIIGALFSLIGMVIGAGKPTN